ncbi:DUF4956 domain-containing protein [Clostridium sp.]|uniref:DUF4956 domain-containing protein n=1 Tax=Clostridium sp. TaxID=1506 RepID=UPI003F2DC4F4
MRDILYEYLVTNQKDITIIKSVEILTIALILGLIIFTTYRITFSGVMYNRKFNVSLVMLTLVTAMVMLVISGDIALSLGMVGALSIVRFRTAVKDPRDTAYIFWCISVGLSVGTQNYMVAIVGTLFLFVILTIFSIGGFGNEDRFLLIIRGPRLKEEEIMSSVFKYFKNSQLRAKNSAGDSMEIVYQIKIKKNKDHSIVKELYAIEGVSTVNIIAQNGETIG